MWQEIDSIVPPDRQAAFYHAAASEAYKQGKSDPVLFQVGIYCQTLATIYEHVIVIGPATGKRRFYWPEYDGTFDKIRFLIRDEKASLFGTRSEVCDDAIIPAFEAWRAQAAAKTCEKRPQAVHTPQGSIDAESSQRPDLLNRFIAWAYGEVKPD